MNQLLVVFLFALQSLQLALAADDSNVTEVITSTVAEIVTILEYRFTTDGNLTTVYATGGTSTVPFVASATTDANSSTVVSAPSVSTPSASIASVSIPSDSVASDSVKASPSTEQTSPKITSNPFLPNAAGSNPYYSSFTSTYTEVVAGSSVIVEEVHLYMSQC